MRHLYQQKSFSVAPMMDMTDRHCRAFLRLFSPNFRLYTEMVVAGSIIYGDRQRFLGFDVSEHPVALQLGGSDAAKLAMCAQLGQEWGYDEINLNVGCPSSRVKDAQFGACLMAKPRLVAECVQTMIESVTIPITVKCRTGIDNLDSYEFLKSFIETVAQSGCKRFIIHARKAWLTGLSPKENRTIPPLHYETVYQLKQDYPEFNIVINGGITNIHEIERHLHYTDGVMLGRQAYHNPWLLQEIDRHFFTDDESNIERYPDRVSIVNAYLPYIQTQLAQGVFLRHMTRHMLSLFHGQPGAKSWRRYLSSHGSKKHAGPEVIFEALKFVDNKNDSLCDEYLVCEYA